MSNDKKIKKLQSADLLLASVSAAADKNKPSNPQTSQTKIANPIISKLSGQSVDKADVKRVGFLQINTENIDLLPYHDRHDKALETDRFKSLVKSIRTEGQILPGKVRETDRVRNGKMVYELVYGRLRMEACKIINKRFEAVCQNLTDEEALTQMFIENMKRIDITSFERVLNIKVLLENYNYTLVDLAKLADVSRMTISTWKRYCELLENDVLFDKTKGHIDIELSMFAKLYDLKDDENYDKVIHAVSNDEPDLSGNHFIKAVLNKLKKNTVIKERFPITGSNATVKVSENGCQIDFKGKPKRKDMELVLEKLEKMGGFIE